VFLHSMCSTVSCGLKKDCDLPPSRSGVHQTRASGVREAKRGTWKQCVRACLRGTKQFNAQLRFFFKNSAIGCSMFEHATAYCPSRAICKSPLPHPSPPLQRAGRPSMCITAGPAPHFAAVLGGSRAVNSLISVIFRFRVVTTKLQVAIIHTHSFEFWPKPEPKTRFGSAQAAAQLQRLVQLLIDLRKRGAGGGLTRMRWLNRRPASGGTHTLRKKHMLAAPATLSGSTAGINLEEAGRDSEQGAPAAASKPPAVFSICWRMA